MNLEISLSIILYTIRFKCHAYCISITKVRTYVNIIIILIVCESVKLLFLIIEKAIMTNE